MVQNLPTNSNKVCFFNIIHFELEIAALDAAIKAIEFENEVADAQKKVEGVLYWAENGMKEKNASKVQKYHGESKTALENFVAKYKAPSTEAFIEKIQQSLSKYETVTNNSSTHYFSLLATNCWKMKSRNKRDKLKASFIGSKTRSNKRRHPVLCSTSKKVFNLSQWHQLVKPLFDSFVSQFGSHPAAQECITKTKPVLDKAEEEAGEMFVEDEIAKQKGTIESKLYWLENSIKQKKADSIIKYANEVREVYEPFVAKYSSRPSAQPVIQKVKPVLDSAGDIAGDQMVEDEIAKQKSAIESKLYWLDNAIKQKKAESIIKYGNELREVFEPFCVKYGNRPSAQDVMKKVQPVLDSCGDIAGDQLVEDDIKSQANSISSKAYWLDHALKNKNASSIERYLRETRESFEPFVNKYASRPSAQETITKTKELIERAQSEIGDIIIDDEIEAMASKVNSIAYWLSHSLEKKHADGILKYTKETTQLLEPFVQKFNARPKAKDTIAKTQAILAKANAEVGDIILEDQIKEASSILSNKVYWVEHAWKENDPHKIMKYETEMVPLFEEYVKKYSTRDSAKPCMLYSLLLIL